MSKLKDILGINSSPAAMNGVTETDENSLEQFITQEEHFEHLSSDKSILEDESGTKEKKLHKEAEKKVVRSAEDSIRNLHVIKMGRCPDCGDHISRHLFASVCETCGWHTFDRPRSGTVRVHLKNEDGAVEGEKTYTVKNGDVIVLKNDIVVSKIPSRSVSWVEYIWPEDEIEQRQRQVVQRAELTCGWCEQAADPEEDGFHLVQVAFGASQERYCFCSDDCYEAFRKMYPARVHRNCYERNCHECNLCVKRYTDETEGIGILAKDYLSYKKMNKSE